MAAVEWSARSASGLGKTPLVPKLGLGTPAAKLGFAVFFLCFSFPSSAWDREGQRPLAERADHSTAAACRRAPVSAAGSSRVAAPPVPPAESRASAAARPPGP